MATKQKARITTAATVAWSDGQAFDGYLSLALALPTGYTRTAVEDSDRLIRVPLWTPIAIKNGVLNADARVWFNSSLVPPNTKYFAYWYNPQLTLVAVHTGPLFTIEVDPYVIAVPTLTVPAVPTTAPTPDVTEGDPALPSTFLLPTIETPAGVIDGVNATFTLANTPTTLIVIRNGLVLASGTAYTLSGATITFLAGYIPQAGDILTAVYWR